MKEDETGLQDKEQTFFISNNREIITPMLFLPRYSSKENRFKKQIIHLMVQRDKLNSSCLSLLNFAMIPLAKGKVELKMGGSTTRDEHLDRVESQIKLYNSNLVNTKL